MYTDGGILAPYGFGAGVKLRVDFRPPFQVVTEDALRGPAILQARAVGLRGEGRLSGNRYTLMFAHRSLTTKPFRFRYARCFDPAGYVRPKAIQLMHEIGIDVSQRTSKHMNAFLPRQIATVITVCGQAGQACPTFPGQVNRYHWGFDDRAHARGSDEQVLAEFRRVRDQFKLVFAAYAAGLREGRQHPGPR